MPRYVCLGAIALICLSRLAAGDLKVEIPKHWDAKGTLVADAIVDPKQRFPKEGEATLHVRPKGKLKGQTVHYTTEDGGAKLRVRISYELQPNPQEYELQLVISDSSGKKHTFSPKQPLLLVSRQQAATGAQTPPPAPPGTPPAPTGKSTPNPPAAGPPPVAQEKSTPNPPAAGLNVPAATPAANLLGAKPQSGHTGGHTPAKVPPAKKPVPAQNAEAPPAAPPATATEPSLDSTSVLAIQDALRNSLTFYPSRMEVEHAEEASLEIASQAQKDVVAILAKRWPTVQDPRPITIEVRAWLETPDDTSTAVTAVGPDSKQLTLTPSRWRWNVKWSSIGAQSVKVKLEISAYRGALLGTWPADQSYTVNVGPKSILSRSIEAVQAYWPLGLAIGLGLLLLIGIPSWVNAQYSHPSVEPWSKSAVIEVNPAQPEAAFRVNVSTLRRTDLQLSWRRKYQSGRRIIVSIRITGKAPHKHGLLSFKEGQLQFIPIPWNLWLGLFPIEEETQLDFIARVESGEDQPWEEIVNLEIKWGSFVGQGWGREIPIRWTPAAQGTETSQGKSENATFDAMDRRIKGAGAPAPEQDRDLQLMLRDWQRLRTLMEQQMAQPDPKPTKPAKQVTPEEVLLAIVNHWWQDAEAERKKLRDLAAAVDPRIKLFELKDIVRNLTSVTDKDFAFEPSDSNGGWLWLQASPQEEALAIPADPIFFERGNVMTLAQQMCDGCDPIPSKLRFKKAYKACRFRPIGESRMYQIVSRGLVWLEGNEDPHMDEGTPYDEILSLRRPKTVESPQLAFPMTALHKRLPKTSEPVGDPKNFSQMNKRLAAIEETTERLERRLNKLGEKIENLPRTASADHPSNNQAISAVQALSRDVSSVKDSLEGRVTKLENKLAEVSRKAQAALYSRRDPDATTTSPMSRAAVAAQESPSDPAGWSLQLEDPPAPTVTRTVPLQAPKAAPIANPIPATSIPSVPVTAEVWRNAITQEFKDRSDQEEFSATTAHSYGARLVRLQHALQGAFPHKGQVGVAHLNIVDGRFVVRISTIEDVDVELFQLFVVVGVGPSELLAFLPPGGFYSSRYPRGYRLLLDVVPDGVATINAIVKPARLRVQADGSYRVEDPMVLEVV